MDIRILNSHFVSEIFQVNVTNEDRFKFHTYIHTNLFILLKLQIMNMLQLCLSQYNEKQTDDDNEIIS